MMLLMSNVTDYLLLNLTIPGSGNTLNLTLGQLQLG